MTASRQLSVVFTAVAGAYTVAMVLSAHPILRHHVDDTAMAVRDDSAAVAVALHSHVLKPAWAGIESAGHVIGRRIVAAFQSSPASQAPRLARANPHPQIVAMVHVPPPHPIAPLDIPHIVVPPPPTRSESAPAPTPQVALRGREAPAVRNPAPVSQPPVLQPSVTMLPRAAVPEAVPPGAIASIPPAASPADTLRITERLKASLTSEMRDNFDLFLYVSKAENGPWAQRMYVFQKQPGGDLALLYNWPVSTGREKYEINPGGSHVHTVTPSGYYELDPHRSYQHYVSGEWGISMPYAMFFNWERNGNQTGLAIHAAVGDDVAKLGSRASAGCVHLSEDNARTLYTLIRSQYRGLAPRFAYDRRTGTMSNQGILMHDASGNLQMAEGYKVLIFIEDFGGENVVAALF